MNVILFTDPTVFHPVGNPSRPQKCERPAGGRVDELLPGGLGLADRLLQILPQNPSIPHKMLDFLGDMQACLIICIHLCLGSASNFSDPSFLEMTPVLVTILNIYRFEMIMSIIGKEAFSQGISKIRKLRFLS
jgi:hypothetical protein